MKESMGKNYIVKNSDSQAYHQIAYCVALEVGDGANVGHVTLSKPSRGLHRCCVVNLAFFGQSLGYFMYLGSPERGPAPRTPTFWGSGKVGVDSIRPQGAPGQGPEGP